jgi:hypothetical protein
MQKIDLYKEYFTHEKEYYAEKLMDFEQGKKYSFNFWAGFLGLTWFCYRKMYVQSVVIFILTGIFAVVTAIAISIINPFNVGNVLYSQFVIWPLSFIVLGYLGNYLYIKQSMKVVDPYMNNQTTEFADPIKVEEIKKKGGTSMTSALICVALLILLQFLS